MFQPEEFQSLNYMCHVFERLDLDGPGSDRRKDRILKSETLEDLVVNVPDMILRMSLVHDPYVPLLFLI